MELTKDQLERMQKTLFRQQDRICREGEPSFHEALGFESGMMFMCDVLGLDWKEIDNRNYFNKSH